MWKSALGGLLLAGAVTYVLVLLLNWLRHTGPYPVAAVAIVVRFVVLVLVVWLGLSLLYRGPNRLSCLL